MVPAASTRAATLLRSAARNPYLVTVPSKGRRYTSLKNQPYLRPPRSCRPPHRQDQQLILYIDSVEGCIYRVITHGRGIHPPRSSAVLPLCEQSTGRAVPDVGSPSGGGSCHCRALLADAQHRITAGGSEPRDRHRDLQEDGQHYE